MSSAPPATTVFAIDPGSRRLGWAVLRLSGGQAERVASGVVRLSERLPVAERLGLLHRELSVLFARYPAQHLAIESAFVRDNPQTALVLGMARGVPIALAAASGWTVSEYPPALVKRTVVGTGRADKEQVQRMIQLTLSLPELPQEDEADALAVGVTCLRSPDPALANRPHATTRQTTDDSPVTAAKAAWLAALQSAGPARR